MKARKGIAAVRELLDGEIEAEEPKPIFCLVPMGDGFVIDVAEPDARIVRGSTHFDDLFPPVLEHNRVVPYRRSHFYRAHLRSWTRREPADVLAALRRLLPLLKELRNAGTSGHRRAIVDALRRWSSETGNTTDDVLLWHIVADVRYQPSFWADLREQDARLINAVERACRPGVNRKAGRQANKKIRHAGTLQAMKAFVGEVHPRISELKKEFFKKSDRRQMSDDERAERVEEHMKDFRATYTVFKKGSIISELTKRLERGDHPADIVEWLARQQFPAYIKRKSAAR